MLFPTAFPCDFSPNKITISIALILNILLGNSKIKRFSNGFNPHRSPQFCHVFLELDVPMNFETRFKPIFIIRLAWRLVNFVLNCGTPHSTITPLQSFSFKSSYWLSFFRWWSCWSTRQALVMQQMDSEELLLYNSTRHCRCVGGTHRRWKGGWIGEGKNNFDVWKMIIQVTANSYWPLNIKLINLMVIIYLSTINHLTHLFTLATDLSCIHNFGIVAIPH